MTRRQEFKTFYEDSLDDQQWVIDIQSQLTMLSVTVSWQKMKYWANTTDSSLLRELIKIRKRFSIEILKRKQCIMDKEFYKAKLVSGKDLGNYQIFMETMRSKEALKITGLWLICSYSISLKICLLKYLKIFMINRTVLAAKSRH